MWFNTTENLTKTIYGNEVVVVNCEQVQAAKSQWRFFFDNNLNAL